jgi:hypothetical protein
MRNPNLFFALMAACFLAAICGSCSGCALFVPEGEATFWSEPASATEAQP